MTHDLSVEIDRDLCIGSGDCKRLAPGTFDLDHKEIVVLLDPAATDADTLAAAERSCPTGAIRVVAR